MSTEIADSERPGLFQRCRSLILTPQRAWARIGAESSARVLSGHVVPLAALSALAGLAGGMIESGFAINGGLIWSGVSAAIFVVLTVFAAILLGWAINWLAPRFGAERNAEQARKLAGYSLTPFLIAGVTALVPLIAPVFLIAGGVYAVVLLVIGLGVLMPPGEQRLTGYVISLLGVGAGVAIVFALFVSPLLGQAREQVARATSSLTAATMADPPPVLRSEGELALARVAQGYGAPRAVDAARLVEQLPRLLPGGFELGATQSSAAPGVQTVTAEYVGGGARLTILLAHYSGADGAAGIGSVVNVPTPTRTADGYARAEVLDGRLFIEEFGAGVAPRYGVVGNSVALIATGSSGVTIDQARAAIETISIQRLEHLFGD